MKLRSFYYLLFVSSYRLGLILHSKHEPQIFAHIWLILSEVVIFSTVLILLKGVFRIEFEISKIAFVLMIVFPLWLINYLLFIKGKKYIELQKNIKTTAMPAIWLFVFSLIFFIGIGIWAIKSS